jgi:hypothetical protein
MVIGSIPAGQLSGQRAYRGIEQPAFTICRYRGFCMFPGVALDLVDQLLGSGGARGVQTAHSLARSAQDGARGLPRLALDFVCVAFTCRDSSQRFLLFAEDPCDG